MRLTYFLILGTFLATFGQSAKDSKAKNQTLFTAGKKTVTTDEFIYLYKKNHQNKPEDFTNAKVEEYLTLFVNFKLKVLEATNRGIDTTRAFQKEFDQYREEIKKPFVSEGDDLDRLVKEAYQRMAEHVRSSHILISLKADATPADTVVAWNKIVEIRNRAIKGDDFESLAKEFSEDPTAKSNGGDLGYRGLMELVYPFESAMYNTPVGKISNVTRTRFGYHILKVIDRVSADEVEVSHIIIRTGQGDDAKARNTIFELNDQLKAGAKWDELCKQYSDDPNTKNNGGRLRQFGRGTFAPSAPEFEKTAFALKTPGDISDPFETKFGWHIVRLEKKIPVPSFQEAQANLTRRIARDERLQFSKAARLSRLKEKLKYREDSSVKNQVLTLADSSLNKGQWKGGKLNSSAPLCEIDGTKFSSETFIQYAKVSQAKNSLAPRVYLDQLLNKWIEKILNDTEEAQLVRNNPEFKAMLDEYREGILLFTIMENEVWNKASEDSIGQKVYYNSNMAHYKAGDRVRARIFSTSSRDVLNTFKAKVANGDTLTADDMSKLKGVSNFRAYEKGESKVIDKTPWAVGTHDVEIEGVYYWIEISNLIAPGIKSFDDARASVISDYQDQLEREWIVALKKKYPVAINSKGKKAVIQELTAKKK